MHDCHILSERTVERMKQFNKRTNYFLKCTINFRNCTNDFQIIVQTVFLSYKRFKNRTNGILNRTFDLKNRMKTF